MDKNEFIAEVNRSIKEINLTEDDIEYRVNDTSNLPPVSGSTVFVSGRDTSEITITYNGKTKVYQGGDGTTFPVEFINDYNNGFF